MKYKFTSALVLTTLSLILLSSCSVFKSKKTGCPTNGKNIGAERLLSGDPDAVKAAKKAKRYKY